MRDVFEAIDTVLRTNPKSARIIRKFKLQVICHTKPRAPGRQKTRLWSSRQRISHVYSQISVSMVQMSYSQLPRPSGLDHPISAVVERGLNANVLRTG